MSFRKVVIVFFYFFMLLSTGHSQDPCVKNKIGKLEKFLNKEGCLIKIESSDIFKSKNLVVKRIHAKNLTKANDRYGYSFHINDSIISYLSMNEIDQFNYILSELTKITGQKELKENMSTSFNIRQSLYVYSNYATKKESFTYRLHFKGVFVQLSTDEMVELSRAITESLYRN